MLCTLGSHSATKTFWRQLCNLVSAVLPLMKEGDTGELRFAKHVSLPELVLAAVVDLAYHALAPQQSVVAPVL